jgi:hypothetical protein
MDGEKKTRHPVERGDGWVTTRGPPHPPGIPYPRRQIQLQRATNIQLPHRSLPPHHPAVTMDGKKAETLYQVEELRLPSILPT